MRELDANGNPTGQYVWYMFTRRHLTQAKRKLNRAFKQLKEYHRNANKQQRTLLPESFSGVYGPVFLEEPLSVFINGGRFGDVTLPDGSVVPLTNALRATRQGFAQRNTVTTLFYIYVSQFVNPGLKVAGAGNYFIPDAHMLRAFAGQIPAAYKLDMASGKPSKKKCTIEGGLKVDNDKGLKYDKAPWATDAQGRPVEATQNTFAILSAAYPPRMIADLNRDCTPKVDANGQPKLKPAGFNAAQPAQYYFQNLASLNYTGLRESVQTGKTNIVAALSLRNEQQAPELEALKADLLYDTALVKTVSRALGIRQEDANKQAGGRKAKRGAQ
jgi:hypothetical protein